MSGVTAAGGLRDGDDADGAGWGYADPDDAVGSLTAAELAALSAADADPGDLDDVDPAEMEPGMPAELAGLSDQELAEAYADAWSTPAAAARERERRAAGPAWPLSYQAAGYPGGEPPIEAIMPRDGTGDGGSGFGDGGLLDSAPASLLLAGFADEAYQHAAELDDDNLVGVLRAYRRLASQAQGRELALVAELARRRPAPGTPPGPPGGLPARLSEFLADELAPSLTLTSRAAHIEVDLALALLELPVTRRLLGEGWIDLPKVRVIVDMLEPLSGRLAKAIDLALVPLAPELTTSQLRDLLARTIMQMDPDAARRRRRRAERQARVEYWADPEGTASLAGRSLPPAEVLAADQRLTALAERWKRQGARGGMDRLRAYAYLALLLGHDTTTPPAALLPARSTAGRGSPGVPGLPGDADGAAARGSQAGSGGGLPLFGEINLTLPLMTLLGLADAPGDAGGYGPQHADTCRDLIKAMSGHPATRWGLIITDPNGYAMAYGGPVRAKPTQVRRRPGRDRTRPGEGKPGSRGPGRGRTDTARGSPAPPGTSRGSPGQSPGTSRGSPAAVPRPFGAGGWTITVTTTPIAPYH